MRRWSGWRRSFRYQARPYALSKNRHCTTLRVEFFWRLGRGDVRGQVRITEDLVGGPHGGIVHFCATDAKVCKAGWPGRRVYHFDIWRPVTIAGVGGPAQKGVKNREVVSVAPPAAQANTLDEDVDAPGRGPQPVSGKPTELQQKLEDIKSRLGGLGAFLVDPVFLAWHCAFLALALECHRDFFATLEAGTCAASRA